MYEQTLKHIAETLMQENIDVSGSGLLYGKMGLVVFFFHYARYTGDNSFEDYAMVLMDSIREQIQQQHVINYADGLAGIGVAVEYLAQNNFVEVDTHEVLEDFDKKVTFESVYGDRIHADLFTGLSGLGRYFLFRVTGHCANDNHIGTLNNKMSLIHITDTFERMHYTLKGTEIEDACRFLDAMDKTDIYPTKVKRMIQLFNNNTLSKNQYDRICQYQKNIEVLHCSKYNEFLTYIQGNNYLDIHPGLYGGLAGIGLYLLSKLDKQHETWMQLL